MTNTKKIKCDKNCNHTLNQVGFSKVNNCKWHTCSACGKFQTRNWILRHESHCRTFAELKENCIEKNHYTLGVHSLGVACNL